MECLVEAMVELIGGCAMRAQASKLRFPGNAARIACGNADQIGNHGAMAQPVQPKAERHCRAWRPFERQFQQFRLMTNREHKERHIVGAEIFGATYRYLEQHCQRTRQRFRQAVKRNDTTQAPVLPAGETGQTIERDGNIGVGEVEIGELVGTASVVVCRTQVRCAMIGIKAFSERMDVANLAVARHCLHIYHNTEPINVAGRIPERGVQRHFGIIIRAEAQMTAPDERVDAAVVGIALASDLEMVERGVVVAFQEMRQPELIVDGRIVGIESQTLQQRIDGFIVSAEFDQHAANVEVRQKSTFQIGNDAKLFSSLRQQTMPVVVVAKSVVRLCQVRVML
jgi:hypothetical protein